MTVKKNERRENVGNTKIFHSNETRKVWPLLSRRGIGGSKEIRTYQIDIGQQRSRFLIETTPGVQRPKGSDQLSEDPESFHCAMGRILTVAQYFGLLPVCGVQGTSTRGLTFRKRSLRTIYASVLALMMFIVAISSVIYTVKSIDAQAFHVRGSIDAATAGAVFYGNSVLASLIFLWLAPRWAPLQHEWRAMEKLVNRWGRPRLRRKFFIITSLVMLFASTEHILSILKNTPSYRWQIMVNGSLDDFLHEYCQNSHNFLISIWDYNFGIGVFIFIVSKIATFTWNFTDLFVMLVATGLAERFKILNKRMTSPDASVPTMGEWRLLRENYAALSSLVKRVDNDVSPIVLLSFANNLYFICLQLLNGLSPDDAGTLNSVYFFSSFAFLVARTIGVTLLAARINDQSRIALPMLYTCPAKAYCIETQRLEHQLATDEIALSGLRFFSITKNFMLAVAGAIVTYEVVLLQFNFAINYH